jgi:hypothetical protein
LRIELFGKPREKTSVLIEMKHQLLFIFMDIADDRSG